VISSARQPGAPPAEPFTPDQLEAHAARIAATHTVAEPGRGRPLLPRLDRSSACLDGAYLFLSAAARTDQEAVGSEDWLRDNHHVVQDQVREIRRHLPRRYYLELPKLSDGPFEGYPRVYVLARELIEHTAGRLDLETVVDFTSAYQRTAKLSMGETWAIPIMIRLGLVEALHRLADGVVAARRSRQEARAWHARLAAVADWHDKTIARLLDDGREQDGRLSAAFVVELLQWLRDQPPKAAPLWQALHRAIEAQGESADEMLRLEHQREAADQLAIGNVVTSMRLVSAIDWTIFFERASVVEQILREDPSGAYAVMDFPTRDRYRHAVEGVARRARTPETAVARAAVALAAAASREDPEHDRRHHIGYYLISRGRFELEQTVGYSPTIHERVARFTFKHPAVAYLGAIAALTAVIVWAFVAYAARHGASGIELWLVALVVLLPASELAIDILHLAVTAQIPPRQLPKLALRGGIPAALRTIVVVPAIFDSLERVSALADDLEVRFLGNRDENLHFALLTDFPDAAEHSRPGDDEILLRARAAVDALNERYGGGRFYLLHRERRWNAREGVWMGWERKRGKLVEFNRLLRGATDTSFMAVQGDVSVLPSIRFVITLDSDTQLPMGAAARLIGTLGHPLNRPRFDRAAGRVTEGYGVLQPRVGVDLVSANRSVFARVFSGHVGVDPYTTAVSDVYQDLFHEGSYVGKGIYDVAAFETALADRAPENTLLSHDLFEGSYARAGLCTDIDVVDEYPTHYLSFASRQHRWVRGDWQIARWLWRTVPDAAGRPVRNVLPIIARWKILDNLRRSLLAPSLLVLLVAGWTVLPGSTQSWTTLGVLVLTFSAVAQVARSLSSRVRGVPLRVHVAAEHDTVVTSLSQSLFWTALVPHQAWLMMDAIVRTLWRLLVTRRRLLEWVSADRLAGLKRTPTTVLRSMWAAPVLAVSAAGLVIALDPARLPLALPLIALWLISPGLVYLTGRTLPDARQDIDDESRAALRKIARRTWLFFEDLLSPVDHWLIPDNYQEDREEVIAHRTSPTNIGLQLLSTLAAYDCGYISASGVVDRLEPVFATLVALPRYRGHARAARAELRLDRRQRQPRRVPADGENRPAAARRRTAHRRARARRHPRCCASLRGLPGRGAENRRLPHRPRVGVGDRRAWRDAGAAARRDR
jgi:cyclic beta-1,2-glucan synthetase